MKKEYNIEQSPFYSTTGKVKSSLKEIEPNERDGLVLAKKRYYKQDSYVKLITNVDFDILAFDKLSSLAKTVLYYILYNCLEYNSATFRLKVSEIAIILNKKDNSNLYKAINELINIKYIAKTNTREVYWINHNKFYKGLYVIDKILKQK